MRILLANKFFFHNGGSEAVMFMEREFLQARKMEVVDFSMRDGRNAPSPHDEFFVSNLSYRHKRGSNLDRVRTALRLIHSPEAVRRIGKLIDHARPDLVHCHNIYHQLTPSIIGAAKRRGVPVVLTLHDYKPICPIYTRLRHGKPCSECNGKRFFNVLKYRCAEGSVSQSTLLYAEALVQRFMRSYEKLDAVIAPSEFMRGSVAPSRFPNDRVHVIYNGVDTERIRPAAVEGGYALYLGRLSAEKGVETLLAAHAEIADRFRLRLAGTGPLEGTLKARYPRAQFLGHLSGTSLEKAISRAGVIVVPSEWYENCPISVLEAMAYGKPIVASAIGGIPELVVHGKTGLLFPAGNRDALADALTRLMQDADLRRCYGAAGRRRVEQLFTLERHNAALLSLYSSVLESFGTRSPRQLTYPSTMQE